VPSGYWLTANIPLLFLWLSSKHRPLMLSLWISNLFAVLGATGIVLYLGTVEVSHNARDQAILFSDIVAAVVHILSMKRERAATVHRGAVAVDKTAYFVLGLLSVMFLTYRLRSGVPLFSGNAARIASLTTVNKYVGLLSGSLTIALAFMRPPNTVPANVLRIVSVLLAFGTASRLLIAAVLLGNAITIMSSRERSHRKLWLILGALTLVSVINVIYQARTDSIQQSVLAGKVTSLKGPQHVAVSYVGNGTFLSARNGLVVYDLLKDSPDRPRDGFVIGGLLLSVPGRHELDPERWVTQELDLDPGIVGAVATPVWAGLSLDYGLAGCILGAIILGAGALAISHRIPGVEPWLAFGVLLGSYGSYLFSAQFLLATLLIALFARWGSSAEADH
jgi:hypothetical protein